VNGRRVDAAKVGIFAAVAGFVLVAFLFAVLGQRWLRREKVYHAVFSGSVAGLDEGSPVRYLGVPAGRVERIGFDEEGFPRIRVTMRLRSDIPVQEGTRATLHFNPLTGLGSVELEGGEMQGRELPPDRTIPEGSSLISQIGKRLPEVLTRMPDTLDELAQAAKAVREMLDAASRDKLRGALDGLASAAAEVGRTAASVREDVRYFREGFLPEVLEPLRRTAGEVESTAAAFREDARQVKEEIRAAREAWTRLSERVAAESASWGEPIRSAGADVSKAAHDVSALVAGEDISRAVARLRVFADNLARLSEQVDRTLGDFRGTLDAFRGTLEGSRPLLAEALGAVRHAVRNVKELVDRLRDDPSALLFSRRREERSIPDGRGQ
jgi:phospholipid/cholesterol/gamma-HCH transport system substrate-binding protein